ncbi:hypothetical protein SAMN06295910_1984 [Allosphingosinicella indica]|uniref:Uncharacterized protein n=2 Tax=Allosphingosinicella indica TaxID=941907 RepID=A0A1X7GKF5_9SPHN|nr:hypothetical protein SAMN06295910_1984 [Allosphingosinicella indica]
MPLRPILLAAPILLAGCTSQEGFPSLGPRPIEYRLGDLPAPTGDCAESPGACVSPPASEPAPAPIADDPALAARISALLDAARKGGADFDVEVGAAQAAADRAGAPESESWIVAQQALSRLEAARAPTVDAIASLDALALERSRVATSEGDAERLRSAEAEAQKIADAQQQALNRIRSRINGG